nr:hypothetical protein [uncultured Cohaesibacter sp.]
MLVSVLKGVGMGLSLRGCLRNGKAMRIVDQKAKPSIDIGRWHPHCLKTGAQSFVEFTKGES